MIAGVCGHAGPTGALMSIVAGFNPRLQKTGSVLYNQEV